jgi:hypothetical protein
MRQAPNNAVNRETLMPLLQNTKKFLSVVFVFLVIGASDFTAVAADPIPPQPKADAENSAATGAESERGAGAPAKNDTAEKIDYEELAAIFKKYNGKRDYSAEKLKSIKQAPLSQTKLTDKDFEKLSRLQTIILWNLGRCHNLTRESLPTLKSLTSARAIDLADTKLFQDYDEIVDTFKDYKNLEFLSVHLVGKEPTEKYKEFLKARPQLTALVGVYSQKVEGGYRLQHKEALHALQDKWIKEGVATKDDF